MKKQSSQKEVWMELLILFVKEIINLGKESLPMPMME